jgi:hypothetical protein
MSPSFYAKVEFVVDAATEDDAWEGLQGDLETVMLGEGSVIHSFALPQPPLEPVVYDEETINGVCERCGTQSQVEGYLCGPCLVELEGR